MWSTENGPTMSMRRSHSSYGFAQQTSATKPTISSQIKRKVGHNLNKTQAGHSVTSANSTTRRNRKARNQQRDSSAGGRSFVRSDSKSVKFQELDNRNRQAVTTPQNLGKKCLVTARLASLSKATVGSRRPYEKKVYKPQAPPSQHTEVAEIKSQTSRAAKQLTSKNLVDLSHSKALSGEAKVLLRCFCLILNSFRRPDY